MIASLHLRPLRVLSLTWVLFLAFGLSCGIFLFEEEKKFKAIEEILEVEEIPIKLQVSLKRLLIPCIFSLPTIVLITISTIPWKLKKFLNLHCHSFMMMCSFFFSHFIMLRYLYLFGHVELHYSERLVGWECHEVVLWFQYFTKSSFLILSIIMHLLRLNHYWKTYVNI